MEELEKYFVITLWSCYHQKSITHMLVNNDIYPHINLLFQKLGGQKSYVKFISSFNVIKQPNVSTWKCHYDEITHIKELQDIVSRVNLEVTFPDGHHDSTIDGDKLWNRSMDWETIGYTRMKGIKSYGPVLNIVCQHQTGLFVSWCYNFW